MCVELHEHGVGIGPECQRLRLDELAVGLLACGLMDMGDDRIGVADEDIVVIPRVVQIYGSRTLHVRLIHDGRPAGSILRETEVVAGILAVDELDGPFAVESLLVVLVLRGHHLADAVDGLCGVFSGGECRRGRRAVGGNGVQIILGTRTQRERTRQQHRHVFENRFHNLLLLNVRI